MKYHLTYEAKPHQAGLGRDEIPEGSGACTAVMIASILFPEDGSYSVKFISMDGRTGEPLSAKELWKVWMMLGFQLAERMDLSPQKQGLCVLVSRMIRESVSKATQ